MSASSDLIMHPSDLITHRGVASMTGSPPSKKHKKQSLKTNGVVDEPKFEFALIV